MTRKARKPKNAPLAPNIPARSHLPTDKAKLGRIRHELRTPINHIIGYTEMLQDDLTDMGQLVFLDDLKKIDAAGRRLLELINSVFGKNEGESQTEIGLRECLADIRTPINHVIGYSEMLAEQLEEAGFPLLKADLQKIGNAARILLNMAEPYLLTDAVETEPAETKPALKSSSQSADEPATRSHWKLLVVDDDEGNREMLGRRLARLGYNVSVADSGPNALALLRSKPFDLLLLDLIMPGMDGATALREMKSDAKLRDVPVIMLSALDTVDSIVECIDAGAEDYISKPFNPIFLRARIGAVLEKKRLRDQEQLYLAQIRTEQEKSEKLLLNILPAPVAARLKNGETSIADSFSEITVIFADVVGFTSLSQHVTAAEVVRLLDEIFSAFDLLAESRGLEKIKTIGDAYMAACGLPTPRADHIEASADFALDMLGEIERFNRAYKTNIQIRVGLHSGPATAGIIGRNKFIYDLWGDTVNTASRMESHGEAGRIHVTHSVFEALRDKFAFDARGAVEVKSKGQMKTYFLAGRKKPAARAKS